MATQRQLQVGQDIARRAADYFARESNRQSLITVTHADISPDLKNALIFLSVIPDSAEATALDFAKRNRTEFRNYLKTHARMKFLPHIDFEIDYGEKNRQRIDDLTR
jgi:ribosome-binding factor A